MMLLEHYNRRARVLALLALGFASGLRGAAWQSDRVDGTFANPPLYADYPDPDIIRVGDVFYFATTTFVNSPGLTILESRDLVNWAIVSHVIARLEGRTQYDLKDGASYRAGIFAPSFRYHDGTFYVVTTPVHQNTRIYSAKNVRGPWQYHELDREAFDPGLFIEADGSAYIATSRGTDGHVTLLSLNADLTQVIGTKGIFYHKGVEGSKIVKRGEWYYIFNALPAKLALTCSRSKSIFGPYDTRDVLDDRSGGHQGAIVDLPDSSWYGFVMRDCGAVGRMTNLCPIFWRDDWPVWGTPDAPGKVPRVARKPIQGQALVQPATSDEFDSTALGLQWQWNHNPDDTRWSLSERPGYLRLKPTLADNFWLARNTLTQKGQGPWSRAEVKFDLSHLRVGEVCGFGTLGKVNAHIAATRGESGRISLQMNVAADAGSSQMRATIEPDMREEILLRTELDFIRNRGTCSYSLDGVHWQALGGEFDLAFDWRTGTFQGEQFAIFCYSQKASDGFVDVDWFRFTDKPRSKEAGEPGL